MLDWLWGDDDPVQHARLAQVMLAWGLVLPGVAGMALVAAAGLAPVLPVAVWAALTLAGMALCFWMVRSGWSRGRADPSLALPQMIVALLSAAAAYGLAGAARGAVLPFVVVALVFGMFAVSPRHMRWLGGATVLVFGVAMAALVWWRGAAVDRTVELAHFLAVATSVTVVALLAGRVSAMRQRMHSQRAELRLALEHIQDLATRDALTGVINRRHMEELLEQEHQRSMRAGHPFCIAVLDIDRFKLLNAHHGNSAGDAVLRALARETLAGIRLSDRFARWSGQKFVLLMSDTRLALARAGLERVRERIAAMVVPAGGAALRITLSIGVAEHRAGESVTQALERADAALYDAKAQGRNRVVAA